MPGYIFYEGPSQIDGAPIVGIVTYGSRNPKTGNVAQTWILRSDIHPITAINTGDDSSICGSCPLRGRLADASERIHKGKYEGQTETVNKGRGCYVSVQNAPLQVYNSYKRGIYPKFDNSACFPLMELGLRYGSYGDPVAIPMKYWDILAKFCKGKSRPGYTHQWKNKKFSKWSTRVMASTHSLEENELASSRGWRTFRTISDISQLASNEIICPASEEGEYKANCATCGACDGRGENDNRVSIAIVAHGGRGVVTGIQKVIGA